MVAAASTLVLAGCRGEGQVVSSRSAPPAVPAGVAAPEGALPRLDPADRAAYARGRRREVALMRAALERLQRADGDSGSRQAAVAALAGADTEREGAAAAGLTPERYHALVERMDSVLRSRGRQAGVPAVSNGPIPSGDTGSIEEWHLLDSLRVELAVLRSRFAAAAGDEGEPKP